MSTKSTLEKSAQISKATSLLNKIRHWLQGRTENKLTSTEQIMLLEALKIPQFYEMIVYSLRGSRELVLHKALINAPDSFKTLVETNQLPTTSTDTEELISFLNEAILNLNDQT